MRPILMSLALTLSLAGCEQPADDGPANIGPGLMQVDSPHSVNATMDRLEAAVRERGFRVFNRIDHAAGADSVDMELRATQLLIFGDPEGGTPLMQNAQTMGIDLPLKALVYEGEDGQVHVAFNHPAFLVARHDLKNGEQINDKMSRLLVGLAETATTEEEGGG